MVEIVGTVILPEIVAFVIFAVVQDKVPVVVVPELFIVVLAKVFGFKFYQKLLDDIFDNCIGLQSGIVDMSCVS